MTPDQIVQKMMDKDAFSRWLDIQVLSVDKGTCTLSMTVQNEMVNGFLIAHGGISYSLSDSALAFAANAHGFHCVSIETNINHLKKVEAGDTLTASCTEISRGRSLGLYQVETKNQKGQLVSFFKGQVIILEEKW